MMLNETRNVLWHISCKCVCRLNSSACNSKQIWNSDTCKCDCNEDFAGIINCIKGYTWNPSTCKCQCDMWCKPSQYLDHKNCVCLFAYLFILNGFKVKNYSKINILIIKITVDVVHI